MSDLEKAVSRNNAMSDRLYELCADMGSLRGKINHAMETSARQRAYIGRWFLCGFTMKSQG